MYRGAQARFNYRARRIMAKQTIFIVEDDSDICRLVQHHLKTAGFATTAFSNGRTVIQEAEQARPSLFLLDVMVPGKGGFELCRTIRQVPSLAATPVVFLTAKSSEADRILGLDLGADDYVSKPFSPRELLPKEPEYGPRQPDVTKRMIEAWNWLERQGLLIRNDQQVADWFIISSDGEELLKSGELPAQKYVAEGDLMLIADSRLAELRKLVSADFDFRKLIRLCEELNKSYSEKCYFATAMLTRGLLDHVPPLFGKKTFSEAASNYGGKSFKDTMQHLDGASRKVADSLLHVPIRKNETLPTAQQVNCTQQLDVLLSEIVRITE